jgi:hypothetical protein
LRLYVRLATAFRECCGRVGGELRGSGVCHSELDPELCKRRNPAEVFRIRRTANYRCIRGYMQRQPLGNQWVYQEKKPPKCFGGF